MCSDEQGKCIWGKVHRPFLIGNFDIKGLSQLKGEFVWKQILNQESKIDFASQKVMRSYARLLYVSTS